MSLTVVGSIAFDSVRTPFGERDRMLGGSAVHFALAASFFTTVHVVGPVGSDFGQAELRILRDREIETGDIERVAGGQTFFWRGHYEHDLNVAHTDDTRLNVFGDFEPKLSDAARGADVLFLGNIQPELQHRVRRECADAHLVALDSMNLWIQTTRNALMAAIAEVDCLMLNDAELRMLTEEPNLPKAAGRAMDIGPDVIVAKRGEHGAALFTAKELFAIPGYLLEDVRDPTGAGDSFAGGFLGYLDGHCADLSSPTDEELRLAMAYGSVLASFNVEDFGTERVQRLRADEIEERLRAFKRLTHFEERVAELRTG